MNVSDLISALSYAGRNPSWSEYEKAAPVDQRAIVARWWDISRDLSVTRDEQDFAYWNWHLALIGRHEDDPRRQRTKRDETCEEFERLDDWTGEREIMP